MTQMLPMDDHPPQARPFAYAALSVIYGWTSRCIHVLAGAGVYDALGDEPETAAALAARTNVNADALERIMRLLASVDVFERLADGRYRHNEISRCYRSEHPIGAGAIALVQGMPLLQAAMSDFEISLKTGGSSLAKFAPEGLWAYFQKHPEEGRAFDAAMTNQSVMANEGLADAYDFAQFRSIADVGGGQGATLAAILAKTRDTKGVLFDLPGVVAGVKETPRLKVIGGDFLTEVPKGSDAYLLKFVLHDWPDDKAIEILKSVRKAMRAGAKLLVIEALRPDTPDFHLSKIFDISMLALVGGRERTEAEFAALFTQTGFRFERVINTAVPIAQIVEAEAVRPALRTPRRPTIPRTPAPRPELPARPSS
ncbi:MAG: hypothetical protein JNJ73_17230 [Hyphomonadaceae bacterium]|nr:hypothetical protein [Hyphomonadaceae bacterium]